MYERYHTCCYFKNRQVRIHTIYGQEHVGEIVDVDSQHVHLRVADSFQRGEVSTSAFGLFGPRSAILTLALFDLLAIALIV
jgi:hypothetical protein